MKVFVTGASGFLATNLIMQLLEQNYSVVGLVRNMANCDLPSHQNLQLVEGSVLDYNIIERSISDCEVVIHAAAETRQDLADYEKYHLANVIGTETIIKLAIKFKLKRFIYVSTVNTIGHGDKSDLGVENKKVRKPFLNSYYMQSKTRAEEFVIAQKNNIDMIVVNPSFMIGKNDKKSSSYRLMKMGLKKSIVFYPSGGKNFVDVSDVANGIIVALKKGSNGEKYILGSENLTFKEFFSKLKILSGYNTTLIRIPCFVLYIVGLVGNIKKFFNFDTDFTLTNMKILCIDNFYSNQKAQSILGIKFRSIDESIKDILTETK